MTLRCQSDPRIISCFLDLFPRVSCLIASSLSIIINFFCGPCWGLLFFYSSCLLQGEGNFPLPVGFLNVAVPEICFSGAGHRTFPQGSCHLRNPGPCELRCLCAPSITSYRKCPQGGSTFACPALVPGATRSLGPVGFLGCEIEWSVPEQEGKGLKLTTFSP